MCSANHVSLFMSAVSQEPETRQSRRMDTYVPTSYVWSRGVAARLNSGGAVDDEDRACRPIRQAAELGETA